MNASATGTTFILEPNPSGHRFWYARLLAEHLEAEHLPRPCIFTTNLALFSSEWSSQLLGRSFITEPERTKGRWFDAALGHVRRADAPFIILEGDSVLHLLLLHASLARLGKGRLRGALLMMRMHPHPTVVGQMRFALKALAVLLLRVGAPDLEIGTLESTGAQQHRLVKMLRLPAIPDPVAFQPSTSSGASWLEAHGLDPHRTTYLVIGELSARKCVPQVLASWRMCPTADKQLVLVGRPSKQVRTALAPLLATQDAHVSLWEGYLSDRDFDTWIATSNYAIVLHRNEGSSGILLKCAAAGTAVIVGGSRSVVSAFRELRLSGVVVSPSPERLAAVISQTSLKPHYGSPRADLASPVDFARALIPSTWKPRRGPWSLSP